MSNERGDTAGLISERQALNARGVQDSLPSDAAEVAELKRQLEAIRRLKEQAEERLRQLRERAKKTPTECSVGSLWATRPKLCATQFLPNLKDPPEDRGGSHSNSAPFPLLMKHFPPESDGPVTRSAPSSQKGREEIGVFFWEQFDEHLKKAETFKLEAKDGGTKSVLEELTRQIVEESMKEYIEGKFEVRYYTANDDAAVNSIFIMSVGMLLVRFFHLLVKEFDFSAFLSASLQRRIEIPALARYLRPDLFWQLHGNLQGTLLDVAVLLELKVPWEFPRFVKGGSNANPTILQNLFQYYLQSEEGRESPSNVLREIRACLAAFQRKYGIICSLNCYTFVHLDDNQNFYVSDRYWVDQQYPDMSLIERLIRFILVAAAEGDKLKELPPFMTNWLEQTGISTSLELIHSMGTGQSTALASSGISVFLESRSGKHRQHRPLNWLDLQDSRRLAGPCPLSEEDRRKPMGELEGDAKRIRTGRVGDVYLKEYDGIKTVSKLLGLRAHRDSDEGTAEQVLKEMRREIEAYDALQELQGTVIPRLLNCGYLIKDIIFMISTEWSGERVQINELSETQKQNAVANLKRIHELGVLHGHLSERNLLLKSDGEGGTIVFIDFSFAKLRERDGIDLQEWTRLCSEEEDKLLVLLNPLSPSQIKRQRCDSE